jgi:hypothetical protein
VRDYFKTVPMKQVLLVFIFFSISLNLFSQRDSVGVVAFSRQKESVRDITGANISIYPVPVRENNFTIKSDKEISAIKITNIIGQDIFRVKYTTPQLLSKIILDNPSRGVYLVVILFSDQTRVVKKVMIEGS